MAQSRKERQKEFNQQLYIAASFFKMKSLSSGKPGPDGTVLDPTKLEARVNASAEGLRPFPHPAVTVQVIPPKEPWTKMQQKNVVRGEEAQAINKVNDANSKREQS